jgi:hypothetical protein
MEKKIRDYFNGREFTTEEDIEKELTELVGHKAHCYDTKIDDGVDDEDEEDEYVMLSAFEFDDINIIVRMYYGDVTNEITYITVM